MPPRSEKTVIVIGGSDPSGGAGIQADLRTLEFLGVSALSVVTAVTAQNEKRFFSSQAVSPKHFSNQLCAVSPKARGAIVKIGMLGSGNLIGPLIDWLKKIKPAFVILDPVLRSSTGARLLDLKGLHLLANRLLAQADLLTPNIPEAGVLSGIKIGHRKAMERAGKKILKKVKKAVLIKGGHLKGPAVDCLFIKKSPQSPFDKGGERGDFKMIRFIQKRIPGGEVHGTGCTLAAAIAGYLSGGKSLPQAIREAKRIVSNRIRNAGRLG